MKKIQEYIEKFIAKIGTDHLLHLVVSALIFSLLGWIKPLWIATLITFALGVAKEVIGYCASEDKQSFIKDSIVDLCYDLGGILIGYFIVCNIIMSV